MGRLVWRDVVKLKPGQTATVGRSATNRIVLQDEACSRNHCELFHSGDGWKLRDLDSRNGTLLGDEPVSGDRILQDGDIIVIGQCRLAFVFDLQKTPGLPDVDQASLEAMTATYAGLKDEEPAILHRTMQPEFLTTDVPSNAVQAGLTRLYRLGLEMGAARTRQEVVDVVLASFVRETVADIAAILLVAPDGPEFPAPTDLQLLGVAQQGRPPVPSRFRQPVASRAFEPPKQSWHVTSVVTHSWPFLTAWEK